MAMKCKCRCCGRQLNTDIAYKVVVPVKSKDKKTVSQKNTYYCSQEEYERMIKKKKEDASIKDEILRMMNEAFGVPTTSNTYYSERAIVIKVHGLNKVHNYMLHNKDNIYMKLSNRSFNSEYRRIKYFFAIINNSIADWRIVENSGVKREYPFEVIENAKYQRKKKRKGFDFLDISDIVESED